MAATFSYAQAAKGVAPQPSAKTMSTEPTKIESKPDEQNGDSGASEGSDTPTKTEAPKEAEQVTPSTDKGAESTATANSKTDVSETSSPSVGNSSTSTVPKDDEGTNTPNGTSESTWDKQSQASTAEKPDTKTENTKEKSGSDKEKEKEKEKKEPPKELKAAPLPSVNVWQQRKEAQEAKAKVFSPAKPNDSAAKAGASKTASATPSVSGDNQDQPKTGSKKKGTDAASEAGKDRKGTKGRDEALPPVGDAALWPTPQVAQGEEKKKAQEKTEKTEKSDKSPVIRPHGKEKWMPVPYVPTAVFNTPLPTASRRGGRSARGGREGGRNGSHGAGADKNASGQAAQGSAKPGTSERGRNEHNSARANSLPAPSKRSHSAEAGLPDSRKPQTTDRRVPKGTDNASVTPGAKHGNGGEGFPRNRDAKPFPRNHDAPQKGAENTRNPLTVDSHVGPRSTQDRRFENGPKSADFAGFHGDRKDKEFSQRGRGSNRGRGGYGGSQNSHFPNNHMSHNFMHPKSFGFNDRQRSQQQGLPNGSQGHRMSLRSPSLPNSASMYGVYPFPSDINTMYGYQPMHTGPMTAMPYPQYMEPFTLMSMIQMQLEYYFSVDNLCKDLFLRKHMDSQGFVALSIIAGFKRIRSLTEDFELLRHVARQLRTVEYVQGGDGIDRLRLRERWEQWVFPVDQRDPSAQHEGPPPPSSNKPEEAHNHAEFVPNGVHHHNLTNGTGEPRVSKTPLSSTAPEFSPSGTPNHQN